MYTSKGLMPHRELFNAGIIIYTPESIIKYKYTWMSSCSINYFSMTS